MTRYEVQIDFGVETHVKEFNKEQIYEGALYRWQKK